MLLAKAPHVLEVSPHSDTCTGASRVVRGPLPCAGSAISEQQNSFGLCLLRPTGGRQLRPQRRRSTFDGSRYPAAAFALISESFWRACRAPRILSTSQRPIAPREHCRHSKGALDSSRTPSQLSCPRENDPLGCTLRAAQLRGARQCACACAWTPEPHRARRRVLGDLCRAFGGVRGTFETCSAARRAPVRLRVCLDTGASPCAPPSAWGPV